MKLRLLAALLIAAALPAHAQSYPTDPKVQQRELDRQRQQLDQQRQQLALLQAQQRRATRDATYCEPLVIVPVTPRPRDRTVTNNYIQAVMADKALTLDQKLRLIDSALGAPRP